MLRIIALVAVLSPLLGCVTVNRYSLFDTEGFGMAATDSSVTGTLLAIAACCGAIGGVGAWFVYCFLARRSRSDA